MNTTLRTALHAALVLAVATPAARAQVAERAVRISPSATSWVVADSQGNVTVAQGAVPVFISVPLGRRVAFDIGTAFAASRITRQFGAVDSARTLGGVTDVQIRGTFAATDHVVLTLGVNVPTGQATVSQQALSLAGMIGTDLLALSVPAYGIGPAVTAGLAAGGEAGAWTLTGGASVRHATGFQPFSDSTARFVPGSEVRLSATADREAASGRLSLGVTGSGFTGSKFGTTATSTGARVIAQGGWSGKLGEGFPELAVAGWHLYTARGDFAGRPIPAQQLTNVQLSLGFGAGPVTIEPTLEGRLWRTDADRNGQLALIGLRTRIPIGNVVVYPGAAWGTGRMAHSLGGDGMAGPLTGSLTGYRATVGMVARW